MTERNTGSSISFPKLTTITVPADGNDRHDSGILIRALSTGSVISAPLLQSFVDEDPFPNSHITIASTASIILDSLRVIRGVTWNSAGIISIAPDERFSGNGTLDGGISNEGLVESNFFGQTLVVNGSIVGTGDIAISNGATIEVANSLELNDNALLTISPNGTLIVKGDLTGSTTSTDTYAPAGTIILNGTGTDVSPQLLEAMSVDKGESSSAFQNNFVFGSLRLENNTWVQIVDLADNTPSADPECLYTNSLIVPAGSTLDLNGLKLYTRLAQIGGTILNGEIIQVSDSGPLPLNNYTFGTISEEGELDEWTFFARAGAYLTIALEPGGEFLVDPQLEFGDVALVDPQGNEIATLASTAADETVLLSDVPVTQAGIHTLRVRAPSDNTDQTGNYRLSAWDVTPDSNPLVLNQGHVGKIETPYSVDTWTFFASAGQQISLNLRDLSTPGIEFALNGPNDWSGFSQISEDSDPVTLPFSGEYTLTVSGTGGSYNTSYAFQLEETSRAELTINSTYNGNLDGSGQSLLFQLDLTEGGPLNLALRNNGAGNRTEIYARRATPPTRTEFEHAAASGLKSNRDLLVPYASPGTWFILVYAERVSDPGPFTLDATMDGVAIERLSSMREASNVPNAITISGAGFTAGAIVELVSSEFGTIAANSIDLHSLTRLTAHFEADVADPGVYDVRITLPGGETTTLPGSFEILPPGEGELETEIIMPSAFGRHAVATIYVEYANVGNASMPAPLLVVKSADIDDSDQPILTLDKDEIVQNYWSGTMGLPPGTSHEVFILASGEQPGVLNPGERMQVPVYYIGLLQPWDFSDSEIEMEVRHWTADDPDMIDWAERREGLRPYTVEPWIWDAVYPQLIAGISTTGEYVTMLNDNARQLSQQGVRITAVDDLWSYEIQQAYGFSAIPVLDSATDATLAGPGELPGLSRRFSSNLRSRNAVGMFGQGWFCFWETKLDEVRDGAVVRIIGEAGSARTYSRDTRTGAYFSRPGDTSELVAVEGVYETVTPNGTRTRFRADGQIDYIEDPNGNRVTASWTGGRLTGLAHTSGATIAISYSGDYVSQVTESTGRSVTFAHQGDHLTFATTDDGKVISYTYETGGSEATEHALATVTRSSVTRTYTWGTFGELTSTFLDTDDELVTFSYGTAGRVSIHQDGGTTTLFFDQNGQIAKVVDPLGNITKAEYDDDRRIERLILPTGDTRSFTWCTCGSPTSITDELGNVTRFRYDHPLKRMTHFIDAKGNVTRYRRDANGNLLSTTYADGSVEYLSDYNAAGLPGTETNRRGQAIDYTWTTFGEIDRQTFEDGSYNDFDYDSRRNLVTMTEHPASGPDKITTFTYDHANDGDNLKRVDYPNGSWVQYFYDAEGRRSQMTDSAGGDTRYEYDNGGRLWRLRDSSDELVVEYLYDDDGRLSRTNKGNATYTTYQYDAAGQILSLVNHASNGTPNSRFDYTYDARGFRKTMDTIDGLWTYGYDPTGQLVSAVFDSTNPGIDDQGLRYFYDALGNRTSTEINGVVTEYVSNELNQYVSVGGVDYEYDADGNLVFDGQNVFEFDRQNRLVGFTNNTEELEFEFDPLGFLTARVLDGDRTVLLNDPTGIGHILAEISAANQTVNITRGLGISHYSISSENVNAFYNYDAIGSLSNITNESGDVVSSYQYTPYGVPIFEDSDYDTPFRQFGLFGVRAGTDEFLYMRNRFYSAGIGRFISIDPIRLSGGIQNFYSYAENTPTMLVDPLGLSCEDPVPEDLRERVRNYDAQGQVANDSISMMKSASITVGLPTKYRVIEAGVQGARDLKDLRSQDHILYVLVLIGEWIDSVINPSERECDDEQTEAPESPPGGDGDGTPGGERSKDTKGEFDPNEKLGPGYGPDGWVAADALLPYRINFENLGPGSVDENGDPYETVATAPAQRVTINDELEDSLDWSTFQITEFGFGDTIIHVEEDTSHYTGSVVTTYNDETFRVAIEAGIDYETGEITVVFQALELDIDLPPGVLTGFLPPEDGTGRGMGHFSYTIRTKSDLPFATQIRNVAVIKFGINESIATDQVDALDPSQGVSPDRQALVTIDDRLPESTITQLREYASSTNINVNWSGDDVGSGLQNFDVYVSEDGGPWSLWQSATSANSAVFSGSVGTTYTFASVARDNAGNTGELEAADETSVTIVPRGSFQPDLGAGKSAGRQKGVGVFAGRQRATLKSKKARTVRGVVTVRNAGMFPDDISVSSSRTNKFFKATYSGRNGNVTSALRTGRFRTGELTPSGIP
ncbi:MAG: hypothetical protein MI807_06690, partial [Verrucomicrobiales bacterium]|nr:hypothetical protein [Verrucomicrobiales bacterium]